MRPESVRSKSFIDCSKWECWNCGAIHHYVPENCQKCRVRFVPDEKSEPPEDKNVSTSFDELISDLIKEPEEE